MTERRGDLSFMTVAELGRLLRSGETRPTELAKHFLGRLETVGRRLNAVVTLTPELALAQARRADEELAAGVDRGPLHGIPYGAKDLLSTAGIPTTWGAAPFRDQVFPEDAAVITRLREAGAVLVAKLAMVECAGGFGYNQPNAALTGPGLNAWNVDAWAGGSSSGSGAAVAAGAVPFAIGSETWGSITTPSAFNGISGLRPTYERVSRQGGMALSWTMDKIGPMARTAEDCDLVFRAISSPVRGMGSDLSGADRTSAPPFRFGVLRRGSEGAQQEVKANFEVSLGVLKDFGTLDEVELPDLPFAAAAEVVIRAEGAAAFEEFITSGASQGLTAPEDRVGLYDGLVLPAVDYLRALRIRRRGARALDTLLAPFDAIVAPTSSVVAGPIDQDFTTYFGDDREDRRPELGSAGNLCGLPAITVPNGFGARGLPTALEFMGRAYGEDRILAAARAYQERTNWHVQHPAW